MADALPIAVTIGEPAGIGPDVILDAWLNRHQSRCCIAGVLCNWRCGIFRPLVPNRLASMFVW